MQKTKFKSFLDTNHTPTGKETRYNFKYLSEPQIWQIFGRINPNEISPQGLETLCQKLKYKRVSEANSVIMAVLKSEELN